MISYYSFENKKVVEEESLDSATWMHMYPPFEEGVISVLAKRMVIDEDVFVDSLDIDERSRYEKDEDYKFMLVKTPMLNHSLKDNEAIYITIPLGIIIKDDKVITISQDENPIIEDILNNKIKNFNPTNIVHFILYLFERNVIGFLDCLKKLNLKRNIMEQELYNSSRNEELRQLLKIEKSLVYFVNSLSTNDLLMLKMKRTDFLDLRGNEDLEDLYEDIIIDNSQALEMSNVYTNILSGTMEAYASIVSNNMNTFIHRLTIITIILMVPTLVASFYGMNLDHLPFKTNPYAFYILIFISILLGILLILFVGKSQKKG